MERTADRGTLHILRSLPHCHSERRAPPSAVAHLVLVRPVKTRADYDSTLEVVGAVINAWDPYSLLAGGAPRDEFYMEVARLVTRIPHIHSVADASREVSAVFARYFGPDEFSVDSCAEVGARLFDELQKAQLLSTPKA